MGYFAGKARAEGDEPDAETFRYPGPRPQTKEAALVMLADGVEASVRSLPSKDDTAIREMVDRIVDGRVYVNDVPMADDFVPPEYRSHDDWGPRVVDEGYYFVMGDHRNNSSDSRHWGFVPKKYIIGKVQLRWWPIPTAHVF